MPLKSDKYKFSQSEIEKAFILSMMTVLDEDKNVNKYTYLYFIEFLDMICRVAITCITIIDTIEEKVYCLLKLLYKY